MSVSTSFRRRSGRSNCVKRIDTAPPTRAEPDLLAGVDRPLDAPATTRHRALGDDRRVFVRQPDQCGPEDLRERAVEKIAHGLVAFLRLRLLPQPDAVAV